jgi:hypothetical protein
MANGILDTDIDLAEFDRLREEIDNRTQLSTNLVLAEIAALGAGISVLDKVPDVLLGLSAVSSFLWLLWMDHTEQIYKIAAYIAQQLAPRLRARDPECLGWERFLRILDKGGKEAGRLLYGQLGEREDEVRVQPTRNIGTYILLLFGFTAPILWAAYSLIVFRLPIWLLWNSLAGQGSYRPSTVGIVRLVSMVFTAALAGYAWYQHHAFARSIVRLDNAIAGGLDVGREDPGASKAPKQQGQTWKGGDGGELHH